MASNAWSGSPNCSGVHVLMQDRYAAVWQGEGGDESWDRDRDRGLGG